jgi:hypothetical protein
MISISKVTVAVLAIAAGIWVGKGLSSEPAVASASAPAAYPTAEGVSYLPSQVVNQAKEIEPLPPTF